MRPTAKQKTANLKDAAICLLMSPSPPYERGRTIAI